MLRLRQIALVAHDLDPVVDALRDTFDLGAPYNDPGVDVFGLKNAVIPVGHQFVEVVAPTREGTAGGRYLERRNGDGGYMVILQCDDHPSVKARIDELGIRKVVESDTDHYCIMQLHPRDTGGSFLEIDVQHGGEALDGPWEPAGPEWQQNRSATVVGITAAEIQSDDPAALSARWAAILDRPSEPTGDGTYAIALDNATLRFAPATDGRGEGLGGIELLLHADHADEAIAKASGRTDGAGGPAMIGGVRMVLAIADPER